MPDREARAKSLLGAAAGFLRRLHNATVHRAKRAGSGGGGGPGVPLPAPAERGGEDGGDERAQAGGPGPRLPAPAPARAVAPLTKEWVRLLVERACEEAERARTPASSNFLEQLRASGVNAISRIEAAQLLYALGVARGDEWFTAVAAAIYYDTETDGKGLALIKQAAATGMLNIPDEMLERFAAEVAAPALYRIFSFKEER